MNRPALPLAVADVFALPFVHLSRNGCVPSHWKEGASPVTVVETLRNEMLGAAPDE